MRVENAMSHYCTTRNFGFRSVAETEMAFHYRHHVCSDRCVEDQL